MGKNEVRTAIQQFYTPSPQKKTFIPPPLQKKQTNKFLATPLVASERNQHCGGEVMPEGPKLEARMAESGARVLEEGAYQLGGLRESCERPQWGPEQSLGQEEFFLHFGFFG